MLESSTIDSKASEGPRRLLGKGEVGGLIGWGAKFGPDLSGRAATLPEGQYIPVVTTAVWLRGDEVEGGGKEGEERGGRWKVMTMPVDGETYELQVKEFKASQAEEVARMVAEVNGGGEGEGAEKGLEGVGKKSLFKVPLALIKIQQEGKVKIKPGKTASCLMPPNAFARRLMLLHEIHQPP